jgi:hypothetical protein
MTTTTKVLTMLTEHLLPAGYTVQQAENDADTLVVEIVLEIAKQHSVTVVAADIEILVMLVYNWHPKLADVYMLSEISSQKSAKRCLIPMHNVQCKIGDKVACQLLGLHALSGCYTTSAMYGIAKSSVYNKISQSSSTLNLTNVLESLAASHDDLFTAGIQLMIMLYGGSSGETINHLRYVAYMRQLANSSRRPRP